MRILSAWIGLELLAMIGCGSPPPETDAAAAEQTAPTTQTRQEPRPFRIAGAQIVTDTFDVRYDLREGRMTILLDTDLGDATKVMVSVSRIYQERGSDEIPYAGRRD